MADIVIRESRPGDGAPAAALWREMGELFRTTNPDTFQVPAEEGLVEWFEKGHAFYRDAPDRFFRVAEVDGVLAGTILASLLEPDEHAARQIQTDLGRRRLHIDSLGVVAAHRRGGVGTALMRAAEDWGRARGAEVILLETETANPLSMPFYEHRMGFSADVVVFRKEMEARG